LLGIRTEAVNRILDPDVRRRMKMCDMNITFYATNLIMILIARYLEDGRSGRLKLENDFKSSRVRFRNVSR
jgi:hypothetical protein